MARPDPPLLGQHGGGEWLFVVGAFLVGYLKRFGILGGGVGSQFYTLVGVPLGLLCLPLAAHVPLLIWCAASVAMIIYAMALPERYDVACGAFAFTLVVTLAVGGEHSIAVLTARIWQTLLGGRSGLRRRCCCFRYGQRRPR